MSRLWQFVLGIERSPGATRGTDARLEFAAWPQGAGSIVLIVSAKTDGTRLFSATGREIWRDLACGLFVLLLVESIFATWAGRSR